MACCSSDWWQAPVYFSVSVALALMAVSTTLRSHSGRDTAEPNKPIGHPLSLDALSVLHHSNFKAVAALLHISPEIFLSSPNSTVFAIQDSALFNTSLPPWALKQLFRYHTLPVRLSLSDLLEKPQGICLPTLLPAKPVLISRIDTEARIVEVNRVLVSQPDIFLGESLVIHGVLGPFFPLGTQNFSLGLDRIQLPVCRSRSISSSDINRPMKESEIEWVRIIHLLSSRGFVPFAIGLHSVLDWILRDHKNLTAITVLAPPNLASLSSASPLLYNIVRNHIIGHRLMSKDLTSMPDKVSVKTLAPNREIEIAKTYVNSSQVVMVSGVQIVAPDMFSSATFVIHGISDTLVLPLHNASV
ncbi:PREDICTED: fasciclin-like arabinogalactan protein 21 [Tarenaya hassleriana]|uniref:fasciclin-like arabinogalactan protein 21 n=1 Tax=Tarenaya hassleriana TaxID=28532 RepID=UPI00053C70A1|nr:PREDICTED: fasciclin-like arabinogalactan protein 21 [Tarenaya hassleriana]